MLRCDFDNKTVYMRSKNFVVGTDEYHIDAQITADGQAWTRLH